MDSNGPCVACVNRPRIYLFHKLPLAFSTIEWRAKVKPLPIIIRLYNHPLELCNQATSASSPVEPGIQRKLWDAEDARGSRMVNKIIHAPAQPQVHSPSPRPTFPNTLPHHYHQMATFGLTWHLASRTQEAYIPLRSIVQVDDGSPSFDVC